MRLPYLRKILEEATRLGLKEVPEKQMWVKSYMFYECEAKFYISNLELLYSRVPLADVLNMQYDKFWKQYQEKFGGDHNFKSLTIYLQEDNQ